MAAAAAGGRTSRCASILTLLVSNCGTSGQVHRENASAARPRLRSCLHCLHQDRAVCGCLPFRPWTVQARLQLGQLLSPKPPSTGDTAARHHPSHPKSIEHEVHSCSAQNPKHCQAQAQLNSPKVHRKVVVAHEVHHLHVLQVTRVALRAHSQGRGASLLGLIGSLVPLQLPHCLLQQQHSSGRQRKAWRGNSTAAAASVALRKAWRGTSADRAGAV